MLVLSILSKWLLLLYAFLRFVYVELPNRGTLPFLDVLIIRNSTIITTLNQKIYKYYNVYKLEHLCSRKLEEKLKATYLMCICLFDEMFVSMVAEWTLCLAKRSNLVTSSR